jgi:trans-2,3-dihydro-3-hydroxyanthranilate isomerase
MKHEFAIVDVFSGRAFGGNQLAVFPDARAISDRAMQALAREFNFAETTFVVPPSVAGCSHRVRIFTPKMELPFAGHPTVGTAAVLAHAGRDALRAGRGSFRFEEGVGPVAVEVEVDGERLSARLTLEREVDRAESDPDARAMASVLSLAAESIAEAWFAGVGVPFCFVRLKDKRDVDRALLDRVAWAREASGAWSPHIFFFAGELRSGTRLYARMFAPALGVDEDPATGSASAALVGTLACRADAADADVEIVIDQGHAMGRPSRIHAAAAKRGGRVRHVTVGGDATIVARGVMSVPPDV